jgi:hypothetical protein
MTDAHLKPNPYTVLCQPHFFLIVQRSLKSAGPRRCTGTHVPTEFGLRAETMSGHALLGRETCARSFGLLKCCCADLRPCAFASLTLCSMSVNDRNVKIGIAVAAGLAVSGLAYWAYSAFKKKETGTTSLHFTSLHFTSWLV